MSTVSRSSLRGMLLAGICALLGSGSLLANGALAIDYNQGNGYGVGYDFPTMRQAERAALNECGRGCSIVVRFPTGCAAYAGDTTPGSTIYGWAPARSELKAKSKAMANCRNYGGQRCVVRVWGCNSQ